MTMTIDPSSPAPDSSGDDWLEQALRHDAAEHSYAYLDDGGFTAKVVAALPPAVQSVPAWRRPALATMWGVAAVGACVALPQVAIDVGRGAYGLLAAQPVSISNIGVALALLGLATWSAAAYALRND